MDKLFVIAIGGTGMRCLESFVHLCAIGMFDNEEIEILTLDTDQTNGNKGRVEQLIEHYKNADYCAKDYYTKDEDIHTAVDFLISEQMLEAGDKETLTQLQKELINKDWFMTLLDLKEYIARKEQVLNDYADRKKWAKKMLINIAKAGFFSSDRTIAQYNEEIWKL